jgi:small-conductance mechanosensitive channel
MMQLWRDLIELLQGEQVRAVLRALAILLVGVLVARVVGRRLAATPLRAMQRQLLRRTVVTGLLVLAVAWALSELGLSLGVLLGAAGVFTVAIGFASQTSVSNVISGLFLMGERPFGVGDVITVDGETGEVLSIDLLSVKLRTFDNRLVRIPNESMLKMKVINSTRFLIRRYDMQISVAYKEDIARVREVLFEVAQSVPVCLAEPVPLLTVLGFGQSAIELQLSVWASRDNILDLRTAMHEKVKEAFAAQGIEIPYPMRTLNVASQPIPVRVVS